MMERATTTMVAQLREGWTYVANSAPIRTILLLFALLSLMGWPFMVLMPSLPRRCCMAAAHARLPDGRRGRGSLVSALALVLRKSVRGLTK